VQAYASVSGLEVQHKYLALKTKNSVSKLRLESPNDGMQSISDFKSANTIDLKEDLLKFSQNKISMLRQKNSLSVKSKRQQTTTKIRLVSSSKMYSVHSNESTPKQSRQTGRFRPNQPTPLEQASTPILVGGGSSSTSNILTNPP